MPTPAEVKAADEWWGSLGDERRISTHRWLSGLSKKPPEVDPGPNLLDLVAEHEAGEPPC